MLTGMPINRMRIYSDAASSTFSGVPIHCRSEDAVSRPNTPTTVPQMSESATAVCTVSLTSLYCPAP